MIRNPQVHAAKPPKKRKGQPRDFTTNLTVQMADEVLDLNDGTPVADFREAMNIAAPLMEGGPEGELRNYPVLSHYAQSLVDRLGSRPELSRKALQSVVDDLVLSFGEAVYFSSNFVSSSQPVFRLTPDLATALTLTEFDGDPDEIRLPFRAIKIKLDPGSGLYLTNELGQEDAIKELEVMQWAESMMSFYVIANKTFIDPPVAWEIGNRKLAGIDNGENLFGEHISEHSSYTVMELIPRLLTNFCLYIQMKEDRGEVHTRGPSRRTPGPSGETVYRVGQEIKLPAQLKYSSEQKAEGTDEARWKIRNRFMVRGHWTNQAHGPGRSLRRRQWKAPYWKGPTTGDELARIYGVDL